MVAAIVLDFATVGFALVSGWLWLAASRHRVRRVSRHEALDSSDINRLVTALNRTQILNSRAALTTACAALLATIRLALDVW